jgi:hypothetical protein
LLFVYYSRFEWPLRAVLRSHNQAWSKYSGFDVVNLNVAFPFDADAIAKLPFQAVVYHLSALTLRWHPSSFAPIEPLADAFAKTDALKIAMPHDDYMLSAPLVAFMRRAGVDLLLSIIPPETWPQVYAGLDFGRTKIRSVLTHYFDTRSVALAAGLAKPLERRAWWLRYRAWKATPWVGAFGQLKVKVGEAARVAAERRGRKTDISLEARDTVRGDRWFRFLADARATVGVEGGSSVHDPTGEIFHAVEAYIKAHPDAPYREVVDRFMGGEDDAIRIVALSPRHIEAVSTRTAQILVSGAYSGVLEPFAHYIPVKPDLSDMDAALDALEDDGRVGEMIERAYADIVASGKYHWTRFFERLRGEGLAIAPKEISPAARAAFDALNESDRHKRWLIQAEVAYGDMPPFLRETARWTLKPLKPLFARTDGYGG